LVDTRGLDDVLLFRSDALEPFGSDVGFAEHAAARSIVRMIKEVFFMALPASAVFLKGPSF
jgi:hypothetical protein